MKMNTPILSESFATNCQSRGFLIDNSTRATFQGNEPPKLNPKATVNGELRAMKAGRQHEESSHNWIVLVQAKKEMDPRLPYPHETPGLCTKIIVNHIHDRSTYPGLEQLKIFQGMRQSVNGTSIDHWQCYNRHPRQFISINDIQASSWKYS